MAKAGAAALLGCLAASGASCSLYRMFRPFLDRELSGPTVITSQWTEITPTEPLRTCREHQEVVLDISGFEGQQLDLTNTGLKLPDGSVVLFDVQMIDERMNVFTANGETLSGPLLGFSVHDELTRRESLPKDRAYVKVRIRSNRPIHSSRILWRCYNQSDMK